MKILENELLVKFDPERNEIITYRLVEGSTDIILNSVYSLSKLKLKGTNEAGRILGEDILIALKGTRLEFLDK